MMILKNLNDVRTIHCDVYGKITSTVLQRAANREVLPANLHQHVSHLRIVGRVLVLLQPTSPSILRSSCTVPDSRTVCFCSTLAARWPTARRGTQKPE
jgi:hypothetical protein